MDMDNTSRLFISMPQIHLSHMDFHDSGIWTQIDFKSGHMDYRDCTKLTEIELFKCVC